MEDSVFESGRGRWQNRNVTPNWIIDTRSHRCCAYIAPNCIRHLPSFRRSSLGSIDASDSESRRTFSAFSEIYSCTKCVIILHRLESKGKNRENHPVDPTGWFSSFSKVEFSNSSFFELILIKISRSKERKHVSRNVWRILAKFEKRWRILTNADELYVKIH